MGVHLGTAGGTLSLEVCLLEVLYMHRKGLLKQLQILK